MSIGQPVADREPIDDLADEFLARYRRGERPPLTEYLTAHPQLADEIRELFPTLVMLERLGPRPEELAEQVSSDRPAAGIPQQLGEYRILREVGRGGMGIVYEAEQLSLGRHVALKVLPAHAVLTPHLLSRFQNEARVAARLHHTNIVPVFGVGEDQGIHFYAMQFIQGHGLDAVLDDLRRLKKSAPGSGSAKHKSSASLSQSAISEVSSYSSAHETFFRSVARTGLQVAEALAYAHSQGVLHRDVKPSNLLLDAHGCVWVTDFGLAKQEGSEFTKTGDVVGTLRYLAPERFRGASDVRTDIYGLGVTLYELLTIRPAFDETDRVRLVHDIVHVDPIVPRRLQGRVPRDLETIVLKAMAKEPPRRYQSAEEMAADLRRFLDDQPIAARRALAAERLWRWCARRPALAGLSAGLLLSLLIGLAGVLWQWNRAETNLQEVVRQKGLAESSLAVAQSETQRAERNLHEADTQRNIAQREAERAEANYKTAREAVDELLTMVSEDELKNQPGLQPLRVRLLTRALDYYQDMLVQRASDDKARAELVASYLRVAEIKRLTGVTREASDAYQKAIDLLEATLAVGHQSQPALQLVGACNNLSLICIDERKFDEAGQLVLRARDLVERVADDEPSFEADRLTALTLNNVAWWMSQRPSADHPAQVQEAIELHHQALAIYRRLAQERPDDYAIQRSLSSTLSNMARRNMNLDRNEEAQRLFDECLEIRLDLASRHPLSYDAQYNLAATYDGLGDVVGKALSLTPEVLRSSLDYYQKSLDIIEPLSHDNPAVAVYGLKWADALRSMASVQTRAGELVGAVETQRRLLAVLENFVAQDPANWHYHYDVAVACGLQAQAERKLERHADSITQRTRARQAWNEARKLEPSVRERFRNPIIDNLANLMQELGTIERLADVYEIALERRELCDGQPRLMLNLTAGIERSLRSGLRGAELSADQAHQAEQCLDLAIDLYLAAAQAAPKEAADFARARLSMREYGSLATVETALQKEPDSASLLAQRSAVLRRLGHQQRASADYNRALEIVNPALQNAPSDVALLKQRARLHFEAEQWQEAAADSAKILASSPNDTQALTYLAQSSVHLGAWDQANKAYARLWQRRVQRPAYVLQWSRAAHELGLEKQVAANEKRLGDLIGKDPVKTEATAWQMLADGDVARFPDWALELALKALELKPHVNYRSTLGGIYVRLGQYQEALEALQPAGNEPPGEASAIGGFWLAIAYHHLGEHDQARAAYKRALWSWKEATPLSRDKHAFIESVWKEAKSLLSGPELAAL